MKSAEYESISSPKIEGIQTWHTFGLWVRAAVAGFGSLVIGIVLLQSHASSSAVAVAMVVGGASLALLACRRAAMALSRMDDGASDVVSSRSAAQEPALALR